MCRYLLFMVVILPTFGFTTGEAYFNFLFLPHNDTSDSLRWVALLVQCLNLLRKSILAPSLVTHCMYVCTVFQMIHADFYLFIIQRQNTSGYLVTFLDSRFDDHDFNFITEPQKIVHM